MAREHGVLMAANRRMTSNGHHNNLFSYPVHIPYRIFSSWTVFYYQQWYYNVRILKSFHDMKDNFSKNESTESFATPTPQQQKKNKGEKKELWLIKRIQKKELISEMKETRFHGFPA